MVKNFVEKLRTAIKQHNSLLCVGLDPDPAKFGDHFDSLSANVETALTRWGRGIIEQTHDLVCCYKPNIAFYEQFGPPGWQALLNTVAAIPENVPIVLDAKRGDIGSTAVAYARMAFEVVGADAVTVSPYLGRDSIAPFLEYPGKAVFVLCYTSNASAKQIQQFGPVGGLDLFEHIVQEAQNWGSTEQIAFVVGATQPMALARFRRVAPHHWVLAPGVGAQGGDLQQTLSIGLTSDQAGLIVPVSRGVIYAADPRTAAEELRTRINHGRANLPTKQNQATAAAAASLKQEIIKGLYDIDCLQFGNFALASGKQSPVYVDLRRMCGSPELLHKVARAYAGLLAPLSFDRLAGIPYAALPIGTAVALAMDKPLIYPRKEPKSYGLGRTLEGVYEAGETVVMLEDVVTTGGSVLKAAAPLLEAGLQVSDVAVLVDREQGGRDNLAEHGYRLHAFLTFSEIIDDLYQAGRISGDVAESVKNFDI